MEELLQFAQQKPAAIAIVVVLTTVFLLQRLFSADSLSKYPLLGHELGNIRRQQQYVMDARTLYNNGYRKMHPSIFRVTTTDGDHIVLPYKYLSELRARSDEEISNLKALSTLLEAKYTDLVSNSGLLAHVVRADLTPGLPRINTQLGEEVERTLKTELPPCEDWTPLRIHQKLLRIVAIVSGSVFMGPELCRSEDYIHASINFTVDLTAAIRALKRWNAWLRPIGVHFIPEVKRFRSHRAKATKFLTPIIEARREALANGREVPDDVLQWLLNKSDDFGMKTVDKLAFTQLILSFAAIHTTTLTTTNALYDLVSMPEFINVLRDEIKSVLKEHDGIFSTKALYQMKLMDSFLRESMRMNPLSIARFQRVVGKPITLSDGTYLPPNIMIEVASDAISHDPELYPNPDTFDPYRFYNLRQAGSESANRYQCVTVSETNLGFGYGRHSCPGRFFAINEIKLILANMLLQFDIKMPDGQTERYKSVSMGNSIIPDFSKELLFKSVEA